MTRRPLELIAGCLFLAVVSIGAAQGADQGVASSQSAVAQEFMTALQRVRVHLADQADSPALRAYVIYDYLIAARLRSSLSASPGEELDTAVDTFIRLHPGPVSRALRHDWLVNLAERKRWDLFLARSADVTDGALSCRRLEGRLASGETATLGADALARWQLPQKQPECDTVFAWLRRQDLITPELAEARIRAALAADNPHLAREFLVDVPPSRSAPLLEWLQLLEVPKAALAMLSLKATEPVEPDALVAGFGKLCSTDLAAANSLLPVLLQRADLSAETRTHLLRSAALSAAYSRTPGAVAAFSRLPDDRGDVAVQEWRVRAALWAGDYTQALAWIVAMPPALATQPRWRYWRARAVGATAEATAAAPLYAEIAGMRDYYGYLAADQLHRSYDLNIHASPDDAEAQATLAAEAGLLRAHALFDCELTDEAGVEWAVALNQAKPATKVQAAHLAARWGWYAQAIATLAQAGEWDDVALRYPRPYADTVVDAGKFANVPGDWIFAVMRQESLFRKDAVSRADARGLMQMLPGTAVAVARRWSLPAPGRDGLFDPAVAIKLGAAYLREQLDRYDRQLIQALAAYNAGPASVARWMPGRVMDADVWIENIPYTETRGYVQHILEHIVAFAKMRDAEPPHLSSILAPLPSPAQAAP